MAAITELEQGAFPVVLFHSTMENTMGKSPIRQQVADAFHRFSMIAKNQGRLRANLTDQRKQRVQLVSCFGEDRLLGQVGYGCCVREMIQYHRFGDTGECRDGIHWRSRSKYAF